MNAYYLSHLFISLFLSFLILDFYNVYQWKTLTIKKTMTRRKEMHNRENKEKEEEERIYCSILSLHLLRLQLKET